MEIKKEDILELMERFEASSLSRMNFTQENISIEFEKTPGGEMPAASAARIFRTPLRFSTHANRFALLAPTRFVANGIPRSAVI